MAPTKPTIPVVDDMSESSSDIKSVIEKKIRKNTKKKTSTRTPSSYVLFSMEYRKEVSTEHPNLSLGEVSKKCGEKWASLTDEEKKVWKDKSDTLKAERNPVSSDQEIKKKRKPSSYLCFSMDYRKKVVEQEPKLSLGEVSKRCGEQWAKLSDEDKEMWKAKANE